MEERGRHPSEPSSPGVDAIRPGERAGADELQPQPPPALPVPREVWSRERTLLERLVGKEPEEILPRIHDGDPLGIHVLVMRRLREQGFILDPIRSFERALREVAFDVALAGAEHLHPDFLQTSVDRALAWLVNFDAEAERNSNGRPPFDNEPYEFVFRAFGARREGARLATVEFHKLPHRARLAFFALLVDEYTVEECLDLGMWDRHTLRRDCWEALRALGHLTPEEVEDAFKEKKK